MMKPTNGELKIMFDNLEQKFEEKHQDVMEVLVRIEAQTTKTNGRVNKLELWRSLIFGAGLVIVAGGALFAKLYIEDVARKIVVELNNNYDISVEK